MTNKYTQEINTPIYLPKGNIPSMYELYDNKKTEELINEINQSSLSDKQKQFLLYAAYRHTVFNYSQIAEYYCHAGEEMQDLMEKSALVIIDYNKAVENGYTLINDKIIDLYEARKNG
jgi:hypothetical protein